MNLVEIKNKDIWEKLCDECVHDKTFLHSYNWGVFNETIRNKSFYFGIEEKGKVLCIFLLILVEAKRGRFFLVPHGPLFLASDSNTILETMRFMVREIIKLSTNMKVAFVRVSPILKDSKENNELFKRLNFIKAPIHMHPEITWVLDIDRSEKDLLYDMRKTTRYLIKQAFSLKDLKIHISRRIDDVDKFYDIYLYTSKVQKFTPFSYEYIKNEFEVFSKDKKATLFFAEYNKKILSTAFIVYWKDTLYYHHGASVRSKIPASYLLHWEIIKNAKLSGYKFYNFWGISPIKREGDKIAFANKDHPWNGLSLFKMGFGGEAKEYVKTQDLIISQTKYFINKLIESARKKKRGF